ncbi:MAG: methyltransferase family protein [Phycisphaerae bacterium]
MVASGQANPPSPARLAAKMVVYAVSFLAFILVAVPYGFDWLGQQILPRGEAAAWLAPTPAGRLIGGIIGVGGLVGYLICSNWLVIVGKGPFVEFDPPREFVCSGPYRWMRNPVAACLIVTVLGEAIYFASPGIFCLFLLGFPLAQYQVTRIEEPRLRKRFGAAYIEYCRRVPRWLPRRPRDSASTSA